MDRVRPILQGVVLLSVRLLFFIRCISVESSEFIQEGVWTISKEPTLKNIVEKIITPLLPYNPTIIEIGKDSGDMTEICRSLYPNGRFIIFTFDLNRVIQLPVLSYPFLLSPQTSLDRLCQENAISQADVIRWDAKELDRSFIKLSPNMIGSASLLSIRTHDHAKKKRISKFITLQRYLEGIGFCLMIHFYKEEGEGEAVFIRKEIYDALFQ